MSRISFFLQILHFFVTSFHHVLVNKCVKALDAVLLLLLLLAMILYVHEKTSIRDCGGCECLLHRVIKCSMSRRIGGERGRESRRFWKRGTQEAQIFSEEIKKG